MRRDDAHIFDIFEAARTASEFMIGIDRAVFDEDVRTRSAVMYQIMIIGEAVGRLSAEYRELHPEVPWRQMAGMRNRLIHGYHDVDLDELWITATGDVAALIALVRPLLPERILPHIEQPAPDENDPS